MSANLSLELLGGPHHDAVTLDVDSLQFDPIQSCLIGSAFVRVQGFAFRVQGSGFRIQGSGFRVEGLAFRVEGLRFRV